MSPSQPQNFANHKRYVPAYHYVLFGIVLVLLGYWIYNLFVEFSVANFMSLLTIIALGMAAFYAREFAAGAQDRVIRLEERMRIGALVPPEMRGRVEDLTTKQLVALRFASDREVADLVQKVFDEDITNQKEIKRLIKEWRADHQRI